MAAAAAAAAPRAVKRRPLRCAAEITQEELSSCFHLPSEAACRKLGIGLTVLKRQCRKFGIKRWPFRKMKSLDRLITNVQAGISPGDQNRMLVKSVEELEEQKRRMEGCQVLDLDENTKRLQQAYSKANHKARRMAHVPELGGLGGLLALSGIMEGEGEMGMAMGGAGRDSVSVNHAVNNVLHAAKAQAQLLQGVAGFGMPGAGPMDLGCVNMAAAVAAAAAAMSGQGGHALGLVHGQHGNHGGAQLAMHLNATLLPGGMHLATINATQQQQQQQHAAAANLAAVLNSNSQMNAATVAAIVANSGMSHGTVSALGMGQSMWGGLEAFRGEPDSGASAGAQGLGLALVGGGGGGSGDGLQRWLRGGQGRRRRGRGGGGRRQRWQPRGH
uniref:RWP-RK domain-containing protein n=1 Tax=Mantoniella antarctica TaxID=81844 RepID=A0A7S0SNS2_9CHLO